MTATYTPEEAGTVIKAVTTSGLAVAIADIGIVSTAIEATAMMKEIVGASKTYPNNALIQAVFSEESLKKSSPGDPGKDITPDNAAEKAIVAINAAVAIVNAKASPEEVNEYKQFIYATADRVANAAGEGLFGTGSNKVSAKEAATLAKLKTALGV
ncbi:MAG: hypothetical protein KME42_27965 [Tildeniella nuda ZEHNDER 1965/U140]|nr:hypothetical protein [Tildeniella nuda ZEHNDER 1965/U140]